MKGQKIESKENNCFNCKYSVQHYAKFRGTLLKIYGSVHCSSGKIRQKQLEKHLREKTACKYWQDRNEKLIEEKLSLKKTLILISERLNNTILILQSEDEEADGIKNSVD